MGAGREQIWLKNSVLGSDLAMDLKTVCNKDTDSLGKFYVLCWQSVI